MRRTALVLSFLILCAAFAVAQARLDHVNVTEGVMEKRLVQRVNPTYPPKARQERVTGTVKLKIVVDKSGRVVSVKVISGDRLLAGAAIDAVKQWEYQPFVFNGEPVKVESTVKVNFTLKAQNASVDIPQAQGVVGDSPGGIKPGQIGSMAPPTEEPKPDITVPLRVRISSGVASGLIVRKIAPMYPDDARQHRIQGTVLLHVMIDKEGNVEQVDLISGHPLLAPAAIEAVRQWKYKPFLLNEKPMDVDTQVRVNFSLAQ